MNNGMKLWFDVESSFMLNHPKIWYMKIQALIIIVFVDQFFLPPFGFGEMVRKRKLLMRPVIVDKMFPPKLLHSSH